MCSDHGLGDLLTDALAIVGITDTRVSKWLGTPCGCAERREQLNALGNWCRRVVSGKIENAKKYLEQIIGSD